MRGGNNQFFWYKNDLYNVIIGCGVIIVSQWVVICLLVVKLYRGSD